MSATNWPEGIWRRREAYLGPGMPIVFSLVPVEHVRTWDDFVSDTGLPPEEVITSIMCPVPIPLYPLRRPRPAGRAELLWHPFLWLPPHMTAPRTLEEATDPDLYALRIALETEVIGLYDRESGTWLDVCSVAGVDLDDPDGLVRARAWLDGADDPALDAIDLTDLTRDPENPEWATEVAESMFESWSRLVWSESAAIQKAVLIDLIGKTQSIDEAREFTRATAGVSASWFSRVPEIEGAPFSGRPSDVLLALESSLRSPALSWGEIEGELVPAVVGVFDAINEAYRQAEEEAPPTEAVTTI